VLAPALPGRSRAASASPVASAKHNIGEVGRWLDGSWLCG
jgi:hypothetical protein